MKSFITGLFIVLCLSIGTAKAQEATLPTAQQVTSLEARVAQLESQTNYLLGKVAELEAQLKQQTQTLGTELKEKPANSLGKMQCKATTKNGTQCKRKAADSTGFCWQHRPKK